MRQLLLAAVLLAPLVFVAAVQAGKPSAWGCHEYQADGQCVVSVGIDRDFPAVDQQVIREVLADFASSPNIEIAERSMGSADVTIESGCYRATGGERVCGFLTNMSTRKVYIDKVWSYANYCCNAHDGMRGVYCHEFMHAIASEFDSSLRLLPSCFNGTSPYLGVEDFAKIAGTYPLGG